MTITKVVLKLMNGGQSMTVSEIAEKSGLDPACVRDAVKTLARTGQMMSSFHEVRYTLTPDGEEKAQREVSRSPSETERLREQALYKRVMRSAKAPNPQVATSVFNWRQG
jgi:DNA-binding IclR family transcriptional regulator